jgi:hypothetical protein
MQMTRRYWEMRWALLTETTLVLDVVVVVAFDIVDVAAVADYDSVAFVVAVVQQLVVARMIRHLWNNKMVHDTTAESSHPTYSRIQMSRYRTWKAWPCQNYCCPCSFA